MSDQSAQLVAPRTGGDNLSPLETVILHSPPYPCMCACVCMSVCSLSLSCGDLADPLSHGFYVLSQIFVWPNWGLESKTGYQKQSIGTVSGSPALNLSWDDFFGSQFYKFCFLGFTNENTSLKKFVIFCCLTL